MKKSRPQLSPAQQAGCREARRNGLYLLFESTVWRIYDRATGADRGWWAPGRGQYRVLGRNGASGDIGFVLGLARRPD